MIILCFQGDVESPAQHLSGRCPRCVVPGAGAGAWSRSPAEGGPRRRSIARVHPVLAHGRPEESGRRNAGNSTSSSRPGSGLAPAKRQASRRVSFRGAAGRSRPAPPEQVRSSDNSLFSRRCRIPCAASQRETRPLRRPRSRRRGVVPPARGGRSEETIHRLRPPSPSSWPAPGALPSERREVDVELAVRIRACAGETSGLAPGFVSRCGRALEGGGAREVIVEIISFIFNMIQSTLRSIPPGCAAVARHPVPGLRIMRRVLDNALNRKQLSVIPAGCSARVRSRSSSRAGGDSPAMGSAPGGRVQQALFIARSGSSARGALRVPQGPHGEG